MGNAHKYRVESIKVPIYSEGRLIPDEPPITCSKTTFTPRSSEEMQFAIVRHCEYSKMQYLELIRQRQLA